jgi:hypothetical protein
MKVLCCHPSGLMYTRIFLRLEPLGVELVAAAARRAGHEVRILDLQTLQPADYFRTVDEWKPNVIVFGINYLANIPEVIDLAKATKRRLPDCCVFAGGHSASFTAQELLTHADGAIDCVAKGEGEEITPLLISAADDRRRLHSLPGVVTLDGEGPQPRLIQMASGIGFESMEVIKFCAVINQPFILVIRRVPLTSRLTGEVVLKKTATRISKLTSAAEASENNKMRVWRRCWRARRWACVACQRWVKPAAGLSCGAKRKAASADCQPVFSARHCGQVSRCF